MKRQNLSIEEMKAKAAAGDPLTQQERRSLRRRGIAQDICKRKVRHAIQESATAEAMRLGWRFIAYECPLCHCWHVKSG